MGVWKLHKTISLTSICGGGEERKSSSKQASCLSSLTCSRGPNSDPHRPTNNNNDKIDIFLVNHNTARKLRPPRTWPRAMPIPGAEAGSSAGLPGHQPATAAAALRAAAHARAPTEAARGQAPRAGYSPRHPQPGMAALRVAGCGIFAPAAARAEPHEPRRATRPRTHSLAEAGSAALVTPRAPPPPRMTSQPAAWRHAAPAPPRPARS